jgi:phosphatidylglycerol:prolipoprotein diacylglycerol transferase
MYPELFHIGGLTVNSFGVMMALAFIVAGLVAHWQFRKRGVKPDFIYGLLIACIIGGLLGAKIHYLIIHPEQWPTNFLNGSGLVWFGGLFGAIVAVVIVTLLSKQRLAAVMDSGAAAVSAGYVVGRIGCFLRGDDYGIPTDLPWGMTFPEGAPPTTVPVHPTQLYESASFLVIFALIVWVIGPRFKREGSLIFAYLLLAGVERFLVEFLRTNEPAALGLTQQQWISVALFFIGIAGMWWFETHGRLRIVGGTVAVDTGVVKAGVKTVRAAQMTGPDKADRRGGRM